MTKNSRQKLKYLESEKCFWGETKSTNFKGLSVAKSCLRPESAPLSFIKQRHNKKWFFINYLKNSIINFFTHVFKFKLKKLFRLSCSCLGSFKSNWHQNPQRALVSKHKKIIKIQKDSDAGVFLWILQNF